jgi:hypothetical protein
MTPLPPGVASRFISNAAREGMSALSDIIEGNKSASKDPLIGPPLRAVAHAGEKALEYMNLPGEGAKWLVDKTYVPAGEALDSIFPIYESHPGGEEKRVKLFGDLARMGSEAAQIGTDFSPIGEAWIKYPATVLSDSKKFAKGIKGIIELGEGLGPLSPDMTGALETLGKLSSPSYLTNPISKSKNIRTEALRKANDLHNAIDEKLITDVEKAVAGMGGSTEKARVQAAVDYVEALRSAEPQTHKGLGANTFKTKIFSGLKNNPKLEQRLLDILESHNREQISGVGGGLAFAPGVEKPAFRITTKDNPNKPDSPMSMRAVGNMGKVGPSPLVIHPTTNPKVRKIRGVEVPGITAEELSSLFDPRDLQARDILRRILSKGRGMINWYDTQPISKLLTRDQFFSYLLPNAVASNNSGVAEQVIRSSTFQKAIKDFEKQFGGLLEGGHLSKEKYGDTLSEITKRGQALAEEAASMGQMKPGLVIEDQFDQILRPMSQGAAIPTGSAGTKIRPYGLAYAGAELNHVGDRHMADIWDLLTGGRLSGAEVNWANNSNKAAVMQAMNNRLYDHLLTHPDDAIEMLGMTADKISPTDLQAIMWGGKGAIPRDEALDIFRQGWIKSGVPEPEIARQMNLAEEIAKAGDDYKGPESTFPIWSKIGESSSGGSGLYMDFLNQAAEHTANVRGKDKLEALINGLIGEETFLRPYSDSGKQLKLLERSR